MEPVVICADFSQEDFDVWKQSVIESERSNAQVIDTTVHSNSNPHSNFTPHSNTGAYHSNYTYSHTNYSTHSNGGGVHTNTPTHNNTTTPMHTNTTPHTNGTLGSHTNIPGSHNNQSGHSNHSDATYYGVAHYNYNGSHTNQANPHTNTLPVHLNYVYHSNTGYTTHTNGAGPHTNFISPHTNITPHTNFIPHSNNSYPHSNYYLAHTNVSPHSNTGFDHQNAIPSTPELYQLINSQIVSGEITIGVASYDKNNDAWGSQFAYSKDILYKIEYKPNGGAWIVLQNYASTDKSILNTKIMPEGLCDIRVSVRNPAHTENSVTRTYTGQTSTITVDVKHNLDPQIIVTNSSSFVNFTFDVDGVLTPANIYQTYDSGIYAGSNPAPAPGESNGLFITVNMKDQDSQTTTIKQWQKGSVYLKSSDNLVSSAAYSITWSNGTAVVSSEGTVVSGHVFIPTDDLMSFKEKDNTKVIVVLQDYLDAACTTSAGSGVSQNFVSSFVPGDLTPLTIKVTHDLTNPLYTSTEVLNVNENGYDVFLYGVSDSGLGVNRVQFPTWTDLNGQDDLPLDWDTSLNFLGINLGGGTWKFHVNSSDHNSELGQYYTNAYIYDNNGNFTTISGLDAYLIAHQTAPPAPVASNITRTTVTLTSSLESMITTNGETKASGSIWTGLTQATNYTAYAYLPSDPTHYQSPNSPITNYSTVNPFNPLTPENPITIIPTVNSPDPGEILTSFGYSGYYPGKIIQIGAGTDGFVSSLKVTDPALNMIEFPTMVNPTSYWRNLWPANGETQDFLIRDTFSWDADYSLVFTAGTPFNDNLTGLLQTDSTTKTIKLDPKLNITTAVPSPVASLNQIDGKIHPSYSAIGYVTNLVRLDATTTGFSNGISVVVYDPIMTELETIILDATVGLNTVDTEWSNTWSVPDDLLDGTYTFKFIATAHDGQPLVIREETLIGMRDSTNDTSLEVRNTIPIDSSWLYPIAQTTSQVYPGQLINLIADTEGEVKSIGVTGSDGALGDNLTTANTLLYANTWNSTFSIPLTTKIGETYTLTFVSADKYGTPKTKTLQLAISNPMGIVPTTMSVLPYDVNEGPVPSPTGKLKVTFDLYGWISESQVSWPAPDNIPVSMVKIAGPDSHGITSWSTDDEGIVVPHDVACGYQTSPVLPTTLPIDLALTVFGSSDFTNIGNTQNSFTDSNTNVPISDNIDITEFSLSSGSTASRGDTVQARVVTRGFADNVSVQFPWEELPTVLTTPMDGYPDYQSVWTVDYTIPETLPVSSYSIIATATNSFNVKPPAGSTEVSTASLELVVSALNLSMFGPASANRDEVLDIWGTTKGIALTVKLVSVTASIPYNGGDTFTTTSDLVPLTIPSISELNTWYQNTAHGNGWKVPNDITADTVLTFTFEATDSVNYKKRAILEVKVKPIIIFISH